MKLVFAFVEFKRAKRSRVTLKLLDVGSCYNPFKDCFDTLAIDLQPATKVSSLELLFVT